MEILDSARTGTGATSPACECSSDLFESVASPQLLNARDHLARGLSNFTCAGLNASGSKSPPSHVIILSYSGVPGIEYH